MEVLEKRNEKKNVEYLLQLIRYFFNTCGRPPFRPSILQDTTFFSVVKNLSFSGIAFLTLSRYNEFKNTWLERELRNYYLHDKRQDKKNESLYKLISRYIEKYNIPLVFMRDTALKRLPVYREGSRFSTDVDILIRKKDLFHLHSFLREQGFLLMNTDFRLSGKRELYTDSFYDLLPPVSPPFHKQEIINGLEKNYRTFNYFGKGAFLEVHVPVPGSVEIDKTACFKYTKDNYLTPEFDLINQANHFFLHLKYNKTQENRHKTFLNFLKRLTDIYYLLYQNPDMQKVISLSIRYGVEHQTYYYLLLAKKHLHFPVPSIILKKLRQPSGLKKRTALWLLPGKKIIRDKHTASIAFYCKHFLSLHPPRVSPPPINANSKEASLLLDILSQQGIYEEYHKALPPHNSKRLLSLIKETAIDGLLWHKLKNNPCVPEEVLKNLKTGYDAVLFFDKILKKSLKDLKDISIDKIFVKDSITRQTPDYIPGTRYSCDVDILIHPGDALAMDEKMKEKNFLSDGVEIVMPDNLIQLAFRVNKNISQKLKHYEEEQFHIKKYLFEREQWGSITSSTKSLGSRQSFYKNIEEKDRADQHNRKRKIEVTRDKSINYHGENGSYIDVHTTLFNDTPLFARNHYQPQTLEVSRHNYILHPEDKVITDACHFVLNISKHRSQYEFQGFLKYLLDYNMYKSPIDAGKLADRACNNNCSVQVWFYLQMLKDYLKADIARSLLERLYAGSPRLERILLQSINRRKLLFNKRSVGLIIYSKVYLERGIFSRLFISKKH